MIQLDLSVSRGDILPASSYEDYLIALAEEINKSGHSAFSPSGSGMWLYCAGSLIPNMMAPDSSSFEAAEGTVAHELGEEWLKTGIKPLHRIGEVVTVNESDGKSYEITITRVMIDYVEEYVNWCRFLPGDHYVETRVYFSEYTPLANQSGTADHAACMPKRLVITDLKYGKGIQVFAYENSQALIYALAFFNKWDWKYHFEEIEIRICQPRLEHFDTWVIDREYLLQFGEFLRERTAACWKVDAPRRPSDKACQWCRVKSTCTALARLQNDLLAGNFSSIGREYSHDELEAFQESLTEGTYRLKAVDIHSLTNEQLVALMKYRRVMEHWWKSVEKTLEARALDGDKIPERKLVESRTNREFSKRDEAVEWLEMVGLDRSQIFETDMRSPAQIEEILRNELGYPKRLAAELIQSFVSKPSGRPTLVPLTDKRPEINSFEAELWDDDDGDMWDDDDEDL